MVPNNIVFYVVWYFNDIISIFICSYISLSYNIYIHILISVRDSVRNVVTSLQDTLEQEAAFPELIVVCIFL